MQAYTCTIDDEPRDRNGRRQGIQGAGRPHAQTAARPAFRAERTVAGTVVRSPRHGEAIGYSASGNP